MNPIPTDTKNMGTNFATQAEVCAAILALDDKSKQRIVLGAKRILRRHPGLQAELSVEDLVQEGLTTVMATRSWDPKKVDFPRMVIGAMRSFASNETRKNTYTRPDLIYVEENQELEQTAVSETAQQTPSPEEALIQNDNEALKETRIVILKLQLSSDKEALAILNMLLDDNIPKREIKSRLGMTDKEFWAADRRLFRVATK